MTRRDNPFRAYLTIIEGCDKSCSYCVVPYTRGPERSRSSASDSGRSAQTGGRGILGNSAPRADRQFLPGPVAKANEFRGTSRRRGGGARNSARALHDVAPARLRAGHCRGDRFRAGAVRSHPPAGAIRIDAHSARDATHVHARGISRKDCHDPRGPASHQRDLRHHRGFPGETEQDVEETLSLLDAAQYDGVFAFQYSPRPNTTALHMPDAIPEEEKGRRLAVLQDRQREIQIARNEALVGETFEVLVDGASRRPASPAGARPMVRSQFQQPHPKFHFAALGPFGTICSCARDRRSSQQPGR